MVAVDALLPACNCDKAPTFFPSDWLKLNTLVWEAVNRVCCEDEFLLRNDASERAVAHRLGMYLDEAILDWTVDCEYNRIGNTTGMKLQPRKELCDALPELGRLYGLPEHLNKARLELKCAAVDAGGKDLERRAYPDLILHKRGCELHNLLIVEIKTIGTEPWKTLIDYAKLHSFTKQIRRTVANKTYFYPRYRFGLFLEFGETGLDSALLFQNGISGPLKQELRFVDPERD